MDNSVFTWDDIELLFIGAGTMGASLAQTYAQNGFVVGLLDISEDILSRAEGIIQKELDAVKGKIFSEEQIRCIQSRILTTTEYEKACNGKRLKIVIEAATEQIDVKKDIFKKLDALCAPHVVFATNSSSLDSNILARVTNRPDKVVWMHYFYLPHKNRGGEFAGSDSASDESMRIAQNYMKLGGKIPTHIKKSRKGGAADIIFVSLLLEAVRMLEEGYSFAEIETAGKNAFAMPAGFLQLMDVTGLPVGLFSMRSFSDSSDSNDPLYKAYKNFFTPPQMYIDLIEKFNKADDKSEVKWISNDDLLNKKVDRSNIEILCERFWAVGFMTSTEVVDSGLVEMDDLESLCENAFVWKNGPFALMNKLETRNALRYVKTRRDLAKAKGIYFPVPSLLEKQGSTGKPWRLKCRKVFVYKDTDSAVCRITLSSPKTANAMNNKVFGELKGSFNNADNDDDVRVLIFDTAPIKTFIAGADVSGFIENVKKDRYKRILEDTKEWQRIIFTEMTHKEKPRIAIIDGQAFGGGVEVALAFADDPNSLVIITDRTSFAFPETKLGIYPGLRGTLLLPQLIHKATDDPELAVAIARYFILAGGTVTASPQMIHYLGLADLIVPANKRDDVAQIFASEMVRNGGRMLSEDQINSMDIPRLTEKLTLEEENELSVMKNLFLTPSLIPSLAAYGLGWRELFFSGEDKVYAQRIARRVFYNSPNAVQTANWLISKGFKDYLDGISTERLAEYELDNHLMEIFRHPDAFEGLSAMMEGRFPEFNRNYPFG